MILLVMNILKKVLINGQLKKLLKYYDKYHTTPSLEVLKVELQKIDNDVLTNIY